MTRHPNIKPRNYRAPQSSARPRKPLTKAQRLAAKKRVYRRRRIAALVALILVIAVIWALVAGIKAGVTAIYDYVHRGDINAISKIAVPVPRLTDGISDCGKDDVGLQLAFANPKQTSVVAGQSISFNATVQHKGMASCLLDASNVSRILKITSGNQPIWASNVCPVDSRQLLFAASDKDVQTLAWNTAQTGTKCQNGAVTGGSAVQPGTYQAQLSFRDIKGVTSQPLSFTVTAPSSAPSAPNTSAPAGPPAANGGASSNLAPTPKN